MFNYKSRHASKIFIFVAALTPQNKPNYTHSLLRYRYLKKGEERKKKGWEGNDVNYTKVPSWEMNEIKCSSLKFIFSAYGMARFTWTNYLELGDWIPFLFLTTLKSKAKNNTLKLRTFFTACGPRKENFCCKKPKII